MARRRRKKPVAWLIRQIDTQLRAIEADIEDLSLRKKVLRLVDLQGNVKDLGVNVVRVHVGADKLGASRERMRLYLVEYCGEVIAGEELEVVAGTSEYARRLRELRVEVGYQIATGATSDPESGLTLKPDQYVLISAEPDADASRRWHVANRIRKLPIGGKKRILKYLQENVGKVVTTEELAYVAKDARSFARRTRELRTEEGFAVATRFTGRPDLKPGQYVLQSLERVAEPHDRHIPDKVKKEVYLRDGNACRACGWNLDMWTTDDPRLLELHHLEHHAHGGANDADNLRVLCNKCHDEVHAGRLDLDLPDA